MQIEDKIAEGMIQQKVLKEDEKIVAQDREQQEPQKKCKYIFICGAIVSGIGKGITNSSMGMLLREYGYEISFMKIDPYLNLDAGTMSPYEHGEVFVTNDGGEVDLDLGNYERFINLQLTVEHSLTTGKLYKKILDQERAGAYLGKTVQVIPHVVNEIKDWIRRVGQIIVNKENNKLPEILLVEVGGTVGDLESSQYYEAVRQLIVEEGRQNVALIQLTYVMSLGGEQKTKPAQNGLKDLRYTGLQADFLVCRSEKNLEAGPRAKLSLQSSISPENIFSVPNVDHIYEVPLTLEDQQFVTKILKNLQLPIRRQPGLKSYRDFQKSRVQIQNEQKKYKVGIFGKYMQNMDAYMSLCKAILEAAYENKMRIEIVTFDLVANSGNNQLISDTVKTVDGIIVPGGFGQNAWEEKILTTHLAREFKIPFLGICYGFQAAVCAQLRYQLGRQDATSQEIDENCYKGNPPKDNEYIIYMPEISRLLIGGSMRCGQKTTLIKDKNSLAFQIYRKEKVIERHRHRFEVNPHKVEEIEKGGGKFSGRDESGIRMEIFELPQDQHPFYVAVQYHPEFTSGNFRANPLFVSFLDAVRREDWLQKHQFVQEVNTQQILEKQKEIKVFTSKTSSLVEDSDKEDQRILEYLLKNPNLLKQAIAQQDQVVDQLK